MRHAISDLVVTDALLDQLGPALISQAALFLYGSTGNGKTSLAERLIRLYEDDVLIPYAVEVDGQIILLYDPVVHQRLDPEDHEPDHDPRWVRCRRPCIVAGGELVPSMLDLRMDEASGTYSAPLQMKANNGILVIDDFGRQLIPPRDLLNRWIVPLDRHVDYLMLRYGVKFQIPFDLMVVFATNLDPASLADEAFLRRIQNKILVEEVSAGVFDEILRRYALAKGIPYDQDMAAYLRVLCLRDGRTVLRACYPSDICRILLSISLYEGAPAPHDPDRSGARRQPLLRPVMSGLLVPASGGTKSGGKRRPFTEEVLFHLFEQEFLVLALAQVEAVLVHDHLHLLDPQLPGLLGDVIEDALAERVVVERPLVETFHLLLKLDAEHLPGAVSPRPGGCWNPCHTTHAKLPPADFRLQVSG